MRPERACGHRKKGSARARRRLSSRRRSGTISVRMNDALPEHNEAWCSLALQVAPIGVAELDAEARFERANATLARWLAASPAELVGRHWLSQVAEPHRERASALLAQLDAHPGVDAVALLPYAVPHRRARWLEVRLVLPPGATASTGGAIAYFVDVDLAHRQRAITSAHDAALAEIRDDRSFSTCIRGFLAGLEQTCDGSAAGLVVRGDGEPRAWTGAALPEGSRERLLIAAQRLRTRAPEGERVRVVDLQASDDAGIVQLAHAWGRSEVVIVDLHVTNPNVSAALLVFNAEHVERDDGERDLLDFAATCARSLLDAHRARIEREEGERRLRTLVANLPGVAYRCLNDRRYTMVFVSEGILDLTGYRVEEVLGDAAVSFTDMTHPDDVEALWSQVQMALEAREPFRVAYRLFTKNGQMKWVWEQGEGVYDDGGQLTALEGYIIDITEERRAREELRQSRENLSIVLDSIGDAVIAADAAANVVLVNPAGAQLTGWARDAARGRHIGDVARILGDQEEPLLQGALLDATEPVTCARARLVDREGRLHTVAYTFAPVRDRHADPVGFVLVVRDVSEQIAVEERLRHAQKMEAVGRLAGGVAHDFNNLLTGIMGYADLLRIELNGVDPYGQFAEMILETSRRAAELTRQLLAFSRRQQMAPTRVDLHETVRDAIALLRRTIDPRIEIIADLGAHWSIVSGDRSQLQNALLNIGLNARDVMRKGGTLSFATRAIDLAEAPAARRLGVATGLYLELTIRDTGPGIPADDLERVFEPFYTSKGVGEGTGLGLAAVYGTVTGHGGAIRAGNAPDGGAVFTLLLPLLPPAAAVTAEEASKEAPVRGHGRVLVADDEDVVRKLVTMMLEALGYTVVAASNGEEALRRFMEDPKGWTLVVLDVQMPVMSGDEALERIAAIDPDVRVLVSSGHRVDAGAAPQARGFLQKPFDLLQLSRKVAEARREVP
ncbi:MAG: PAS domain S-box protein [Deltaproteobacteria bacterium]|nr:MAG: PAS domain S-box protein [Deltaproteobacteria bacterium]